MIKLTEQEFNQILDDNTGLEYQAYCLGYSHAVFDKMKADIQEQKDTIEELKNKKGKQNDTK